MSGEPRKDVKLAWYLGNTTVREAQRLRTGLEVLANSPLNGDLKGKDRENALALLLNEAGLVRIRRGLKGNLSDLGRKWRAAMMQLGFITPDPKRLEKNGFKHIPAYSVTENGKQLIDAQSLPAQ